MAGKRSAPPEVFDLSDVKAELKRNPDITSKERIAETLNQHIMNIEKTKAVFALLVIVGMVLFSIYGIINFEENSKKFSLCYGLITLTVGTVIGWLFGSSGRLGR